MSTYVPTPEQFGQIVATRNYKEMYRLIDAGLVPVDYRQDTTRYTPLMIVCYHCNYYDRHSQYGGHGYDERAIKYLLEKGANPNVCCFWPVTTQGPCFQIHTMPLSLVLSRAFHGEACMASLNIIKMLLAKGARTNPWKYNVDTNGSEFGMNKTHIDAEIKRAVYRPDDYYLAEAVANYSSLLSVDIVKELLRYGCRQDTRHGGNGQLTPKEVLLKVKNANNITPLEYKSHKQNIDKLLELLDQGVEVYEKNELVSQKMLADEAERKRLAEEAERQRLAYEAEQRRIANESERKRLANEAEQRRIANEIECKKLANEAEQKRLRDEIERKRLAYEAEQKRLVDEAVRKRLEHEAEQQKLANEAERKRLEYEAMIKQRMASNPLFGGFSSIF